MTVNLEYCIQLRRKKTSNNTNSLIRVPSRKLNSEEIEKAILKVVQEISIKHETVEKNKAIVLETQNTIAISNSRKKSTT